MGAAAQPLKPPDHWRGMELPTGWSENRENGWLERELVFADFTAALAFVNRVGVLAEELNHHPDILLHGWNKVRVASWSHDVGAITDRDHALAGKVNALLGD